MSDSHLLKKDIHIRLQELERREFELAASSLGVTMSELVRLLIQLPTECMDEAYVHAVYLDAGLVGSMHMEMVRWGHHYNQAVRAMNTVRLRTKSGFIPEPEYSGILKDILGKLEDIAKAAKTLDHDIRTLEDHPLICGQFRRRPRGRGRPRKEDYVTETPSEYNDRRLGGQQV